MAPAGKTLRNTIALCRLSDGCEAKGTLSEEQYGFHPQRSTVDKLPVMRPPQELWRKQNTPTLYPRLLRFIIGLQNAYGSADLMIYLAAVGLARPRQSAWQDYRRHTIVPLWHAGMRAAGRRRVLEVVQRRAGSAPRACTRAAIIELLLRHGAESRPTTRRLDPGSLADLWRTFTSRRPREQPRDRRHRTTRLRGCCRRSGACSISTMLTSFRDCCKGVLRAFLSER